MARRELSIFLISSLVMTVATAVLSQWFPADTRCLPVADTSVRVESGSYLSTDNRTTLDQLVFFHRLEDVAEPIRAADVILAGNSRSLFAFRSGTANEFFGPRKCRWYHAGFPAETSLFTTHVLTSMDAAPSLVVVNADDFFRNRISMMAKRTVDISRFGARKQYSESKLSFALRHQLHQWLPHFPTTFCAAESMIVHRSVSNGAWQISSAIGRASDVDCVSGRSEASPQELQLAEDFHEWVRSKGARLVVTYVPKPVDDRNRARHIAGHLGCAFIAPVLSGLRTIDGSHLDERSATEFARAFYAELARVMPDAVASRGGQDVQ